jgi:two-component system CheB/CheR fusion protein
VQDSSKSSEEAVSEGLPAIIPDGVEEMLGEKIDSVVPSRGYNMLPVVGLGGSAGSLSALQNFFAAMPQEPGMAFVVILHLAPDHVSSMSEVLSHSTAMPVHQARDGEKVQTNSVYVIPPGKFLTIDHGVLRLSELEPISGKRVTVDLFFRALADCLGAHATAIVLSGADGDGSIGIKRIKERGGLTIAQDPEEAQHQGMPRSAIETGMIDWVLKAKEIPERLIAYRLSEKRLKLPPEEGVRRAMAADQPDHQSEPAFRDVLTYLRTRTGHDFSYYKRATIIRRLSRRMQVNGIEDVPGYLVYLRTHPGEAAALLQDLLISVTNFFRDRDAFAELEKRIPLLFQGKTENDTIRVWVPACATGEEAFSIAMLLSEHARTLDAPPTINIFATDLDETVIQTARAGFYPETIAADVSEERLRRFFTREPHGYRVRRDLRETILFAVQDLLKDSPFSRLDLVSCRNLLIYLNREAQARALEIFHFALRPKGLLFLGVSESVGESVNLFAPFDKKHRLYSQTPSARTRLPIMVGPSTLSQRIEGPERPKPGLSIPTQMPGGSSKGPPVLIHGLAQDEMERMSWADLHFKLLERLGPPSIVVNRDYEILHLSETAGRFLNFAGGEATMNLLKMAHPSLRVELRTALYRVSQSKSAVTVHSVPHVVEGTPHVVDITVAVTPEMGEDFLLVSFQMRPVAEALEKISLGPEPVVQHLEKELEQLRNHLNETVEQYEGSTEELKASNEELQAINEELRTATEELETSREELQSVNEELTTVNQELKSKVDEVGHANSDLHNLMAATSIATIFVDRDLKVVRFTPSAVSIFRLIPTDLGRPLSDLTHQLAYPSLAADSKSVVDTLAPIEREISEQSGKWFLVRMLPYRSLEDRIEGVVLTFIDITGRRKTEESLRVSNERLRLMIENAREFAIFSTDLERRVTSWNSGGERLLQYRESEILGHDADIVFTPEDRASGAPAAEAQLALTEGRAVDERWHLRRDGSRFWGSGYLMSMQGADGKAMGFVKILHDRTKGKETEEALVQSREQLVLALKETEKARKEAEAAGKTKDRFLAILSHELRTPLTPVLMAAESLLRRKDLPPRAVEALQMICRNIEVETHFIDDLLDITKISRGTLEVLRMPMSLHSAVKGAIEITEARFQAKNQKLTVFLKAQPDEVRGDFQRLQQVFWNLLINASKFTPNEGEIRVESRIEDSTICVDISDTGKGIDPNAIPDIFLAFKQGDETIAREYGGLGLGLAISKATVEALGGSIVATSEGRGRGAIFTVKLPAGNGTLTTRTE